MRKEKEYCWGPNCNKEIETHRCCSGHECGCAGLPIEPPFCSEKCYDAYVQERQNEKDEPSTPLDFGL